ncbi:MAG: MarR family transcriptional regulator [Chloroflexi bacterium]|uniref:MarR family transcriptional regulator n=1 Tax=Candidatus Chlorohelix allophototropha TaxID=3003348 RepID=A0A8T7M911_9CHLR|nr:MarR family transcriptional regulator [Chloroflexota bacterium]WJW68448.1 MarR family transcriptional regulator [Chloroflexota bacterium L227-S17]
MPAANPQTQEPDTPKPEQLLANEDRQRRCAQEVLTIIPLLRRIIQRERDGSELPITLQQYSVLKVLHQQQYLISELADIFKVSRPTMTRIIDGLEGRHRNNDQSAKSKAPRRLKLVERVDSPDDRRLVYARITSEGEAVVRRYHSKAEESVTSILNQITGDEFEAIEKAMNTLRRSLEQSGDL